MISAGRYLPGFSVGESTIGRLEDLYWTCLERIRAGEIPDAVHGLATGLAALRARLSREEWRDLVCRQPRHPLFEVLQEDPYHRAARNKPRGYAGDADTLDFVYRRRLPDASTSALGRRLLEVSTSVPIARAVRARTIHVADLIRETTGSVTRPVVVSVACGHLRELHEVADLQSRLEMVGFDQDGASLAMVRTLHAGFRLRLIQGSVRDLISGATGLPGGDFVYAAGLFDYLQDAVAGTLARRLVAGLRPGGVLLIANLTPANEEIACMEAVWDWWMVYRDASALRALGDMVTAGTPARATVHEIADGRVACLRIQRDEV